jgi:hypothetical protein
MAAHTLGMFLSLDAFIKSSEQEIQIDSSRKRNMSTTVDVDLYLAWVLRFPLKNTAYLQDSIVIKVKLCVVSILPMVIRTV